MLLLLLVGLATLQYRWIGEVSRAEEDRMRAAARRAADGVATDFNREIARVLEHFGLPPRSTAQDSELGPLLAQDARHWSAESRFPSLIAEIFVARLGSEKEDLDQVNLSSGLLEPAAWPSELEAARQWIKTSLRASVRGPVQLRLEGGALEPRHSGVPSTARIAWFGPQVLDEIPAILIPDMRRLGEPGGFGKEPIAKRWVILRLDRHAILTGFLPQLVRRHFGESGEYDVAVLRRDYQGAVLYRSREGFSASPLRSPDAEVFFFSGRLGPVGPDQGDRPHSRDQKSLQGPLVLSGDQPFVELGRGTWRLMAVHRAGSLQAAVRATRRRNLAISGAILLLLAAAVAALVSSAQRAQRLARQQIEFVAGLTHELRTPLAAIRSAGQNLADGVITDKGRVRQYGRLLEREGRRLSGLIEDALAHAGIQARRNGARMSPIAIPQVLEEAIVACRPLAQEQEAALETEIAKDLPEVAGDPSELRTLFENLVSNAIKYGGRAGQVQVEARSANRSVEVTVKDRGLGISRSDLPHIFEPFYRGSEGSSGRVTGSGLGLSLVRRIVEAHGGSVRVESEPGSGTTFHVTLPAAPEVSPGLSSRGQVDARHQLGLRFGGNRPELSPKECRGRRVSVGGGGHHQVFQGAAHSDVRFAQIGVERPDIALGVNGQLNPGARNFEQPGLGVVRAGRENRNAHQLEQAIRRAAPPVFPGLVGWPFSDAEDPLVVCSPNSAARCEHDDHAARLQERSAIHESPGEDSMPFQGASRTPERTGPDLQHDRMGMGWDQS
jgi:signal transduction histidine kinase